MQTVTEPSGSPQPEALDRPALGLSWLDWDKAIFGALVLLAAGLRFWDLGSRSMHHDESLHALYSWYLYTGAGYQHDPLMHGPFQFHATALIYFLFGDSDYTARILPAIMGTAAVAMPYFLRDRLGRTGALCAAALLALSPVMLYYSRFIRNDIYIVFWDMLLLIGMWRYIQTRQPSYLILGALALGIGFATKEVAYLTVLIFGGYLFFTSIRELLPRIKQRLNFQEVSPRLGFLLVMGTLVIPQGAASVILLLHAVGIEVSTVGGSAPAQLLAGLATWISERTGTAATLNPDRAGALFLGVIALLPLTALAIFIGQRWNWNLWIKAAAAFYIPYVILYTTVFTHPAGFGSGIWNSLAYWIAQQEVQRGGQPWFYYLLLLPVYEFLPIVLALAGIVVFGIRQRFRDEFAGFLVWWLLASILMYSYAGEKMPWLSLHTALPAILLAGKTLGAFLDAVPWALLWERRGGALAGIALLLLLALGALFKSEGLVQNLVLLGSIGALGVSAWLVYRKLGLRLSSMAVASALLIVLGAFSIRSAWLASYAHGDIAVEMLVYTQSSPALPDIMRNIERIADETGQRENLPIAVDASDGFTWPWAWYLRNYKNVGYPCFGVNAPGAGCVNANNAPATLMTTTPTASVVLLHAGNQAGALPYLDNYAPGQPFPHRWWFPERYRELTWASALQAIINPSGWWDYFYQREIDERLGSSDALVYYPRGLEPFAGFQPPGQQPDAASPVASEPLVTDFVIGGANAAADLGTPRGIALDSGGNIYVGDSQNNRILKYSPEGTLLAQTGSVGQEPGQFIEPWGVAVDAAGNVYVADTWNHRVQKFDSSLRYLTSWGTFAHIPNGGNENLGGFYGPRSIALDAEGNIYVTDTGNKRVQKFSPQGVPLASFGTAGAGRGQFLEPVGIAISPSGEFWVADTWNRRVQHFDSAFNYLDEFPVEGWQGQRILNKPYLAVDAAGNIVITDPERHRLLRYSPTGELIQRLGGLGADQSSLNLPAALAVDAQGRLYVSDSGNSRILRLPPLP